MSRPISVTKQLRRVMVRMALTAKPHAILSCHRPTTTATTTTTSLHSTYSRLLQLPNAHPLGCQRTFVTVPCAKPAQTFDKLLIANRGEIACRIIKTARAMNVRTVAVYSVLDADARHVRLADEAVCIGDAQAYLSIPDILKAVRQTGAQAVHPGYGFLSENPAFVRALEKEGIVFVGPKADAIAAMGDKIQSKLIAKASGVNCIPGYDGQVMTAEEAVEIAHAIGYPVMIKASAGGGGKGMRIAWNDQELREGFKLAKQESKSAFDDDRMLVEKYIDQPRHIEIQVLGDNHGNVVYLPPRECSIQRRNQKVVEESPSVHVDNATWHKMGRQAVALAKHVGYNSAGTVEFLVDEQKNFYFLEMNTRLQVEHPVTEYVTGLDLVEQMLYSAADHPLAIQQDQVRCQGWSIESRVYAEDPTQFLPSVGRLIVYREPRISASDDDNASIRCDSGVMEGSDIVVEYDPLLCKLTTHGKTRDEAIGYMVKALDEYVIKGVTHNLPLLRSVVDNPRFRAGKHITTDFLKQEYPEGYQGTSLTDDELYPLAVVNAAMWAKKEMAIASSPPGGGWGNIWVQLTDEQSGRQNEVNLSIAKSSDGDVFEVSSPSFPGKMSLKTNWALDDLLVRATIQESKQDLIVQYLDSLAFGFRIQYRGDKFKVAVLSDRQRELSRYMKSKPKQVVSKTVVSPMPGRIISVAVSEGDKVTQGQEVAVVEAMKMQNVLRTSRVGTIKKIHVQQGNAVGTGQVLIEFEDEEEEKAIDL